MADSIFKNLDSFKIHDHVCHLYHSNSECLDIGSKFIVRGLKKDERCIVVQKESVFPEFTDRIIENGINLKNIRQKNLLIEIILKSNEFHDTDNLISRISNSINKNEKTRILINEEKNGHEQTLLKESKLSLMCNQAPSVIMHQYNLDEINQKTLLDLFKSHNLLILENLLHNSPLYMHPRELIKRVEEEMQPTVNLTVRENEILKHLVNGYSNKRISRELRISVRTIEAHRNNIMKKLDARTVVDLVKFALKNRIIQL